MKIVVGISEHKPSSTPESKNYRAAVRCPWTGAFIVCFGRNEEDAIRNVLEELRRHRESLRAIRLKGVEVDLL